MAAWELTKTILKDSANLKAYYRFESGALTTDSSGNAHTLSAIGTPTEDASGVYGGAVAYASASSQAHSATDHADFKPTGSFSISAWIKTSTSGSTQFIFQSQSQNTAVAGMALYISGSDNKVKIQSGKNTGTSLGTDYQLASSTQTVTDGSWHHIVGVYNSSTLTAYVDGKAGTPVTWANNAAYAATNYVRIGCANNTGSNTSFMNGSVDDLAFFNGTALSADQIKELYEGRIIGEWLPQTGVGGLWHLNGNSTDTSGNNRHGTDTSITYSQANGKFFSGAGFNGSSSKIVLPSGINLRTQPGGMFVWVKLANATLTDRWDLFANNPTDFFSFNVGAGGDDPNYMGYADLQSWVNNGWNNSWKPTKVTIIKSQWFLLGYSYSRNSQYRFDVYDPVTKKSDSTGDLTPTLTGSATGGANSPDRFGQNCAGTWFNGAMDEIVVFANRYPTKSEFLKYAAWSMGRYI